MADYNESKVKEIIDEEIHKIKADFSLSAKEINDIVAILKRIKNRILSKLV